MIDMSFSDLVGGEPVEEPRRRIVHPAVSYVDSVLSLTGADKALTYKQALAIVCRLISAGFLDGTVDAANGIPLKKEK